MMRRSLILYLLSYLLLFLHVCNLSTSLSDAAIRCRSCGAYITKHSDYIPNPDPSQSRDDRIENIIDPEAKVYTYRNPSQNEFEIVTFSHANGIQTSKFTEESTFFNQYSWKMLQCSQCKNHLGWYFRHTDLEICFSSSSSLSSSTSNKLTIKDIKEEEKQLMKLNGICSSLNVGWWIYRYCHLDEIRQFHEEEGKITMDWSLGKYNGKTVESFLDEEGNLVFSYLYIGGQKCDETNELRQTKVLIQCCKNSLDLGIHLAEIQEQVLCKYTLKLCFPFLCKEEQIQEQEKLQNQETRDRNQEQKQEKEQKEQQDKKTCEKKFQEQHPEKRTEFYGIIWSNVVSEDSEELKWTKDLKTITALSK